MNPSDPTTWQSLGWLSFALVSLIGSAHVCRQFYLSFQERPAPSEKYQTKQECQRLHTEAIDRLRRTEERMDMSHTAREDDRAQLREDLAEFRKEMSGSIREVHGRMDDLAPQIIAILRNTGAIK